MSPSARSTVKRSPKRGVNEKKQIYELVDSDFLCHISFIHHGAPVVIPTMYGRMEDSLFIHGASVSRLITELEDEVDVCLSIAQVNALVLARSAFHHSLNYESVVIFGKASLVTDETLKMKALKCISDNVVPGRWEEVRLPNAIEMKATKVIEIRIEDASAKIRTGPPVDDKEDYESDYWAGLIPLNRSYGAAIEDPLLKEGIKQPSSVINFGKS